MYWDMKIVFYGKHFEKHLENVNFYIYADPNNSFLTMCNDTLVHGNQVQRCQLNILYNKRPICISTEQWTDQLL